MKKFINIDKKIFLKKFEKILNDFCQKLDKYTTDPNDENIHDTRVAIRRLEAAYRILPKSVRRQEEIS